MRSLVILGLVSHDGSEILMMRTILKEWIDKNFNVKQEYIPLKKMVQVAKKSKYVEAGSMHLIL